MSIVEASYTILSRWKNLNIYKEFKKRQRDFMVLATPQGQEELKKII